MRAKKLLFLFGLILFVQSQVESKNFLWEIKSDKGTVYLLGSFHLAKESLYPLDKNIEAAFNRSDFLVLEMNPDSVDINKMQAGTMFADTTTLSDVISDTTYQKLKVLFEKYSIPEAIYSRMRPWAAATTIQQMELMSRGFNPEFGIDMHFLKQARGNKPILELESFDAQLELFTKYINNQDGLTDYLISDLETDMAKIELMLEAWKKGDAPLLQKYLDEMISKEPGQEEITKVLLDDRNINMATKIEDYLRTDKKFFVIAGAAHLLGDNGILKLLGIKKQYKIKQL
jgi:uncharacterized protein